MHHQSGTICSAWNDVNTLNIVLAPKKNGRTNTTLTCCFEACTQEDCYGSIRDSHKQPRADFLPLYSYKNAQQLA